MGRPITGVWVSPDRQSIAVQVDEETIIQYYPGDSDGYEFDEVDALGADWITYIPEHVEGGVDHQTCIPLEQA